MCCMTHPHIADTFTFWLCIKSDTKFRRTINLFVTETLHILFFNLTASSPAVYLTRWFKYQFIGSFIFQDNPANRQLLLCLLLQFLQLVHTPPKTWRGTTLSCTTSCKYTCISVLAEKATFVPFSLFYHHFLASAIFCAMVFPIF